MRDLSAETFRQHLLDKYSLPARARARVENPANSTLTRPLRELWEATDLSAAEFADEVSNYFGVVRLNLPQLLAAAPCLDGFSRRQHRPWICAGQVDFHHPAGERQVLPVLQRA